MADHTDQDPQIVLSTMLDASIDDVWQALQRPATLAFVSRG
jgi:uncharacterized protein YndB with AHSA1/START domain